MQKKEEKLKKKDDKTIEQILKSLNSINSPDEKLVALCKKYTDILDENRKMQVNTPTLYLSIFLFIILILN